MTTKKSDLTDFYIIFYHNCRMGDSTVPDIDKVAFSIKQGRLERVNAQGIRARIEPYEHGARRPQPLHHEQACRPG